MYVLSKEKILILLNGLVESHSIRSLERITGIHRNGYTALRLMSDLRKRIVGEFQLSTDGFRAYVDATEMAFGTEVHFGQLVKIYSGDECIGARPSVVAGYPKLDKISTSYVKRNNLTMRMSVRRIARKTNAVIEVRIMNGQWRTSMRAFCTRMGTGKRTA